MRRSGATTVACLTLALLCGINAAQQAPPAATNLKVLPKNTSTADLYKRMATMQHDLGVSCSFCHAEDPDTKQINYASDENPRKETARLMMRMTNDINDKYLGTIVVSQDTPAVTCGNCHLGQMHPPAYGAEAKDLR
jgi:hypothetical protein